jgi:hypothetical protein
MKIPRTRMSSVRVGHGHHRWPRIPAQSGGRSRHASCTSGWGRGRRVGRNRSRRSRRRGSCWSDHPGWWSGRPPLFQGWFDRLGSRSDRQPRFRVWSECPDEWPDCPPQQAVESPAEHGALAMLWAWEPHREMGHQRTRRFLLWWARRQLLLRRAPST